MKEKNVPYDIAYIIFIFLILTIKNKEL